MGLKHRWKIESYYDRLLASEKQEISFSAVGKWNVLLIFPASYSLGISNLGFQTVHRLFGEAPGIGIERFFYPVGEKMSHPPPYYSLETKRPIGDFDIFAFSISFEGDFEKIPVILGPLGISCLSKKRKRSLPLLIAGGAGVAANPRALEKVFDVLVLGEGETVIPALLKEINEHGLNLAEWDQIPGIWLPGFQDFPKLFFPPHPVSEFPAYSHIISSENIFGGSSLFEAARGCPRVCAFCFARVHYHPFRFVPAEKLFAWLDRRPHITDLGLVAPSLFDHPQLMEIINQLNIRKIRLRNSSVKWEALNDQMLKSLAGTGITSLTLAPETGSSKLAVGMGKPLMLQRFYDTIKRTLSYGFTHLKLYFMVGIPGETEEDIEETVLFIKRIAEISRSFSAKITAAFSGFVPKAGTPWESNPIMPLDSLKKRFRKLKAEISDGTVNCVFESPAAIERQYYFSTIGPEFGEKLEEEAKRWRKAEAFPVFTGFSQDF